MAHPLLISSLFSDLSQNFSYFCAMQVRELSYQQYLYLSEVLGVEMVLQSAKTTYQHLVLLSASPSAEEKELLSKILSAFGWQDNSEIRHYEDAEGLRAEEVFSFGREAETFTAKLAVKKHLSAPSLAVLLNSNDEKKKLWAKMKAYME